MEKRIHIPPVGSTWRWLDYKYHLVLVFEDGDDTLLVVKYYGKRKQWWHYEVWTSFEYYLRVQKDKK